MLAIHSFHGGIHPPENKLQSTGSAIATAPIPEQLILPVSQHIGAPAEPLVKVGERVLKGQLIAEPIGRISASIHAPTSGVVSFIGPRQLPHASGMEGTCIVIDTDGQDEWCELTPLEDYQSVTKPELLNLIRQRGISGMGGAGFPTDVKLHLGDDHIVNTLVINAVECEPYITADDMLMRERADEIVAGIEIVAHLLKPSHVIIGIEDNKPNAIRAMELALQGHHRNVDLAVVPTKYPSGGEKQLIKLVTGVEVPSGRIPADVGIVCQNVGTVAAVYRAVVHGQPLISRVVTVTGDAVDYPQNFETLVGTPYQTLLNAAGVRENDLYRLVMGGPMMGFTMPNAGVPVVKATNCIIAATSDEMPAAPPAQNCIRCGMCEQVCPAELLPQQLYWFSKAKEYDKAQHHNLFDCIECGACSYVCPSNIPLVQYYRNAKSEIRQEHAEKQKAEHARLRFEARKARLEREKVEKEQRRKARAAEAAAKQAARKDAEATGQVAVVSPEDQIKQLKTAAAVARTKLKKAEKQFTQAQESGEGDLAALEAAFKEAQAKAQTAQQKLADAESGANQAAPVLDVKALKTAAAVARTKLKKAQTALKNAQDKGQDGIEALQATVKQLEAKSEAAEQAYQEAQNPPAQAAPVLDLKALKTAAAVARTKLKQAEKALIKAQESGYDTAEFEAKVAEQAQKVKDTQAAFEAAEQGAPTTEAQETPQIDLKPLEEEVEKARGKVTKAEAAAKTAQEKGLPTAEKMLAGVEKLKGKLAEAQKELDEAVAKNNSAANAMPAASQPKVDPAQITALEEEIAALEGKVAKAETAAKMAEEKGLPTAEKMRAGVAKLQGKLTDAKAELAGLQATAPSANVSVPADTSAIDEEIETLKTKIAKAQGAADMAVEKGLPTAEKMKAGVEKLQGKLADLEAERAALKGDLPLSEQTPAQPPVNQAQLNDLLEELELITGKVNKAQQAADNAKSKGLPSAEKMLAGVEKLRAKAQEAEQAYVAAGGKLPTQTTNKAPSATTTVAATEES